MSHRQPRFADKSSKLRTPRCAAIPCERITYAEFTNGAWCLGWRKSKTARPCDVISHCELNRNGKRTGGWHITLDEGALMITGIANVIAAATIQGRTSCRRSQCSEWEECGNAVRPKS